MSELAFNIDGQPFDLPATATGWRVRRMRARGAPTIVHTEEGVPLVVPITAKHDELRQLVVMPGRYRLDAIDDRGRLVGGVPPAYVLVQQPRETSPMAFITDAMKLNIELTKAVIERFTQMVHAAAELVWSAARTRLTGRGDDTQSPLSVFEPVEVALARTIASVLEPGELRAWFDEMKQLSVPQIAEKIRGFIKPTAAAAATAPTAPTA